MHKGHKHKVTQVTPEKERTNSFKRDLSLSLIPCKEIREEQCGNCGLEMSPEHQCEIEELLCEKCNIIFIANAHLMMHIEYKHSRGPKCEYHANVKNPLSFENCKDEPEESALEDI